jgi:hypothetical protein
VVFVRLVAWTSCVASLALKAILWLTIQEIQAQTAQLQDIPGPYSAARLLKIQQKSLLQCSLLLQVLSSALPGHAAT